MTVTGTAFWAGRRVLVTGGSGLVGSHLSTKLLSARAEVTVLLRDPDRRSELFRGGSIDHVAVVAGRLEDPADVERAVAESEASVVFHLGAQTIVGVGMRAPLLTLDANVRGTYNLLEACRRYPVERVLIASSDKAYGASDHPYRETDPLLALNPYDVSKAAADMIAQSYHASYGMPLAILRCGNTYGGGDLNWSRIIPGTIRSYCQGEAPEIRSDGSFVRDYIHVDDVVAAYLQIAEALPRPEVTGHAFNVAAGTDATVLEVVKLISELIGGSLPTPRILNATKGEIREQRLDTSKVRSTIGWTPRVGLREGLQRTIAWYRAFLEAAG